MSRKLKIAAIVAAIFVVIVIALPLLIDANTFRPTLESELSGALGRPVKVGNLSLSIFSGSVKADDISIADDPDFSKTPFVQAKSLIVGVEIMPLIFSKKLDVTELTLNDPEIALVKSQGGEKWNFSSLGGKNSAPAPASPTQPAAAGGTPNLSVAKLNVENGRLTVSRTGSSEKPRVYDKVIVKVTKLSMKDAFPFKMTVDLPAGGKLDLDGKVGPINVGNAEMTPLNATVSVKEMNVAESGFIDRASGISGIADFNGSVTSNGRQAKTNGVLKVAKLQVVQKGSPAGKPVQVTYTVTHDLAKQSGEITQGEVAMGGATAHLTGTYNSKGDVTTVELKLNGQAMPVDDLEAMLPALGVVLPPKATLKGGDLNTNLAITGPVDKLVITGSVQMENTALVNFDLGSQLSSISALGGKKTGNDTTIQNFSSDVRVAPEGTQANNINLNVPAIGVMTGDGTVNPSNALAFKMKASVSGLVIPFDIEGTTSAPKFVPDVKGLATGLVKGLGGNGVSAGKGFTGLSGILKQKSH
jgi:AsmA protein